MSTTPDHGLRIKTPPPDEDYEPAPVYRKALEGIKRAEKCNTLNLASYMYILIILMISALKLSFSTEITSDDLVVLMYILALFYFGHIILVAISTRPIPKNILVEDSTV
jgi:hypothetical protein